MLVVIFADKQTNLEKYENLNTENVVIYSDEDINTSFNKADSSDIFIQADVIILTQNCIKNGQYDIQPIKEACEVLKEYVLDDKTIIFDTPVPPRTTYKMSKILDELDLIEDISLAYTTMITDNTLVIGHTNRKAKDTTINLYENMADVIKSTDNIQTAEAVPILQNAYKDTLIALANQTSILSEAITIDLIEAIKLANLDEDVHLLNPEPVLHENIIRDSSEIIKLADEYGETAQLSQTTRDTNNYVAYHIAYMAEKELYLKEHLAMFETTVAILGVTEDETLKTQKDNASLILIDDFVQRDVEVWVHDDKVEKDVIEEHGAKKITLDEAYDADCIIIMTDSQEYRNIDPERVEKVIITALPVLESEKFKDKKYSSVGQYRLKRVKCYDTSKTKPDCSGTIHTT